MRLACDHLVSLTPTPLQENVKQADETCMPMLVETLIRLDYNTGEWKTFRKFSKIGQSHEQNMSNVQGVAAS